jgi:glycine cleavage system H protein
MSGSGIEDRHVHLGLTNYIQGALGTVISVELPDVGDQIEEGEIFAEIESVSTVHELPLAGDGSC